MICGVGQHTAPGELNSAVPATGLQAVVEFEAAGDLFSRVYQEIRSDEYPVQIEVINTAKLNSSNTRCASLPFHMPD